MNAYTPSNQRLTGIMTVISGALALGSMIVGLVATGYDFEAFSNPAVLLNMGGLAPELMKWFMLLDMFGYYLLLLPVIFYAHRQMDLVTPWAATITASGFAYVIIGATGASALAAAWPSLMLNYQSAADEDREVFKTAFLLSNDLVVKGMWNTLEVWLAGAWWIGLAMFTIKSRALRITTIILGAACVLDGLGEAIGAVSLASLGLNVYLILAIVWAIWIGVYTWRGKY